MDYKYSLGRYKGSSPIKKYAYELQQIVYERTKKKIDIYDIETVLFSEYMANRIQPAVGHPLHSYRTNHSDKGAVQRALNVIVNDINNQESINKVNRTHSRMHATHKDDIQKHPKINSIKIKDVNNRSKFSFMNF